MEATEDRYTINTFPTLQELASYRVVFTIWYNYLESFTWYFYLDEREFNELAESLQIPQAIKKQLQNSMSKFNDEMNYWRRSFDVIPIDYKKKYSERCLDPRNCSWLPNGKLDYKKSILMVLPEKELNAVEKFTFMCEYCFEDEIKKVALESLPFDFVEQTYFSEKPLVYYWIRYLKNELDKIPLGSYNSVDFLMAATYTGECWPAFEYFWNRLSESDQIALAEFKLIPQNYVRTLRRYPFQERLISMMSWTQQRRLLSRIPHYIIYNFCRNIQSPQCLFWAWQHSKNTMSGRRFGRIVNELFSRSICVNFNTFSEGVLSPLIEIWDTAPNHLKKYAGQHMNDTIVDRFRNFPIDRTVPTIVYQFLHRMLLAKDVDDRKNFILKNAIAFGARISDPRVMNDILDICLPNQDDRSTYKETILNSSEFESSLKNGFKSSEHLSYDNIDLKVTYYTKTEQHAREYKKKLLMTGLDDSVRADFVDPANWKWTSLAKYIDTSFPDQAEALEVKKSFIMAFVRRAGHYWKTRNEKFETYFQEDSSEEDLYAYYWDNVDSFQEFAKFIETMFAGEELKTLKMTFLNSFKEKIAEDCWFFRDRNYFQKIIMWCVDNDQRAFDEFKKNTLRAECIFDYILKTFGCKPLFTKLIDELLIWYFDGDVAKKTDYKRRRMLKNDRDNCSRLQWIICMLGYDYDRRTSGDMDVFLNWALEGDEQAVQEFKNTKKRKLNYYYSSEDDDDKMT